jgi:hypothetical protein
VNMLLMLTSRAVRHGSGVKRCQLVSQLDAARPLRIRAAEHCPNQAGPRLADRPASGTANSSLLLRPDKTYSNLRFSNFLPDAEG